MKTTTTTTGAPGHRRLFARRDEKGASLVEFALILPVFALILFAIVDFGMLFSGYTTMRGGVQASARLASLDQHDSFGGTCGASDATSEMVCTTISDIGKMYAVNSSTLKVGICFINSGTACSSETSSQKGNQCVPGGSPSTYCEVEICASVAAKSTTGVTAPFLNGKTVSTNSTVRLELGTESTTTYGAFNASSSAVTYNSVAYGGMNCT
jgi:Flp pilus assembly protein TadG